ncbi:hypothetical protein R3P38DRAFT_3170333 [Favolaschia claudopus]|uniref:Uncharacterized protein n=1 Tax=Favolaschia claudopus TaxID=2862362 RepID=A0AAW0DW66_9AGAR
MTFNPVLVKLSIPILREASIHNRSAPSQHNRSFLVFHCQWVCAIYTMTNVLVPQRQSSPSPHILPHNTVGPSRCPSPIDDAHLSSSLLPLRTPQGLGLQNR